MIEVAEQSAADGDERRGFGGVARAIREPANAPVAVAVAALALVAAHVWLSAHLPDKGPIILLDEGGYLGNATDIARGLGRPLAGYYGGYSLLLVPASVLRADPRGFYEAVLVTNAALSLLTAALAFLLARRLFPDVGTVAAALVSALVVLQPFTFAVAHLAMSENALIPTTLLAALLLAKYAEGQSPASGVAAALAASFAFWISPRGVLVVAAFVVALAFVWLRNGERPKNVALIVVALMVSVVTSVAFNKALRGGHPVPGVEGVGTLPSLVHASTWRDLVASTAGRFGYLGVATSGLALIGLVVSTVWMVRMVRHHRSAESGVPAPVAVGLFASTAVVLTILASSFTMPVSHIDVLYYGRYTEGVAMPLVVIGAGWLVSQTTTRSVGVVSKIAGAAAGATVLFALTTRLFPNPPPTFTEVPINVAAVFGIRELMHMSGPTAPLVVGALATGAMLLLARIDARLTLVAILVVFGVCGSAIYNDFQRPYSAQRRRSEHVVHSVVQLEQLGVTTRCVSYDKTAEGGWPLGNDVFLLPGWRFVPAGPETRPSCRSLLLTAERPNDRGNWKLISGDRVYVAAANLWVDLSAFSVSMQARLAAVH